MMARDSYDTACGLDEVDGRWRPGVIDWTCKIIMVGLKHAGKRCSVIGWIQSYELISLLRVRAMICKVGFTFRTLRR
jgi:hypothetical protein